MMMRRNEIGKAGENAAAAYIVGLGWQIIERNWRCAHGEIDLIAYQGNILVLVEVRTRRGKSAMMKALASVDARKQERLMELAQHYMQEHDINILSPFRIDVIGVAVLPDGMMTVEHVRDAIQW